jgi:hypothetical protein
MVLWTTPGYIPPGCVQKQDKSGHYENAHFILSTNKRCAYRRLRDVVDRLVDKLPVKSLDEKLSTKRGQAPRLTPPELARVRNPGQ